MQTVDNSRSDLTIEVYSMKSNGRNSTLTKHGEEPDFFDVWLRTSEGELIEDHEDIPDYAIVEQKVADLQRRFPNALFDEIGG